MHVLRTVAWRMLVGVAAGSIAGLLAGGIGGRLAMLLLRLTSPGFVVGMESDDGFEIGVVSTATIPFLFAMAAIGGFFGVLYAAIRPGIPERLRLPLYTLFGAALGGAAIVHDDGIDFALLEPALLAILLFVAIPASAAVLVVVLVERWSGAAWAGRRLTIALLAAAAASTVALALAAAVGALAFAVERVGLARHLRRPARILVPVALVAVSVAAGFDLVGDSSRILD